MSNIEDLLFAILTWPWVLLPLGLSLASVWWPKRWWTPHEYALGTLFVIALYLATIWGRLLFQGAVLLIILFFVFAPVLSALAALSLVTAFSVGSRWGHLWQTADPAAMRAASASMLLFAAITFASILSIAHPDEFFAIAGFGGIPFFLSLAAGVFAANSREHRKLTRGRDIPLGMVAAAVIEVAAVSVVIGLSFLASQSPAYWNASFASVTSAFALGFFWRQLKEAFVEEGVAAFASTARGNHVLDERVVGCLTFGWFTAFVFVPDATTNQRWEILLVIPLLLVLLVSYLPVNPLPRIVRSACGYLSLAGLLTLLILTPLRDKQTLLSGALNEIPKPAEAVQVSPREVNVNSWGHEKESASIAWRIPSPVGEVLRLYNDALPKHGWVGTWQPAQGTRYASYEGRFSRSEYVNRLDLTVEETSSRGCGTAGWRPEEPDTGVVCVSVYLKHVWP